MHDNAFLDRRVIAYAHQGGAREAPSSTIAAISQALNAGATAIELDVHATADGHLVACHDPTLERTTNGSGAIKDHSLEELEELDNAYWFVPGEDAVTGRDPACYTLRGRAPEDASYCIATLEEVLSSFPGVLLNLDVKKTAPEVKPYEAELARLLRSYERKDD
ncbi:MAG: glycerophosphodiester phosphodiesterase family protein, partial [Acidimicrobiales bacterium]